MCYKKYCSICLNKIYKNQVKLNCNHYYHHECLKEWLKYNNICPNCRSEINNDLINIINSYQINCNRINCNQINCNRINCNRINCKEYFNFFNIKKSEYSFINKWNCNSKYNIINTINNIIFFILFWILIILFLFIIGFIFYNIYLLFSKNSNKSFSSEFITKFSKPETYFKMPPIGIFFWMIVLILYKCYQNINLD